MSGYLVKAEGGWRLVLRPMLYLQRLQEEPVEGRGVGRFWCYTTPEAALLAAAVWDVSADTEPVGWVRRGGSRAAVAPYASAVGVIPER